MHWTLKKSGIVVASASAAFATWTNCDAGLFDGLFQAQEEAVAVPRQMPDKDCSYGYFPTKWRPWDTCCEQPQDAEPTLNYAPTTSPYDAPLTIPSDLPPGSVIYENGQPLQVPPYPGAQPGTIVAPPAGAPGSESTIPVPSAPRDFPPATTDPNQFPLPPIHPGNQPPVAPPSPNTGIVVPSPAGVIVPPGTPRVLLPGPTSTPEVFPSAPQPLPSAAPEDGSILIPDPLQSVPRPGESAIVPPAPGTAQFVPMQPFHLAGPLQPTSHTSRATQNSFQEFGSSTDDSGWRVMKGYYGSQPGTVSSAR